MAQSTTHESLSRCRGRFKCFPIALSTSTIRNTRLLSAKGAVMHRRTIVATLRCRCRWKAEAVLQDFVRYLRNEGLGDLKKGDFSQFESACAKMGALRNTGLARREYENYKRKMQCAVRDEIKRRNSISAMRRPNLASTLEVDDWKRRMGLAQVNRPRMIGIIRDSN